MTANRRFTLDLSEPLFEAISRAAADHGRDPGAEVSSILERSFSDAPRGTAGKTLQVAAWDDEDPVLIEDF